MGAWVLSVCARWNITAQCGKMPALKSIFQQCAEGNVKSIKNEFLGPHLRVGYCGLLTSSFFKTLQQYILLGTFQRLIYFLYSAMLDTVEFPGGIHRQYV
jgi:hypothetical protein